MAKKKSKKTSRAASPAPEKGAREIAGIVVISLGILSLAGLLTKAPLLERLVRGYRLIFGIGVYAVPIILFLAGLSLIVWKRRATLMLAHSLSATLWVACMTHVLRFREDFSSCAASDSLEHGGGFAAGLPACLLNRFLGPAGGFIVLTAAALIYFKLASAVSYRIIMEKAGAVLGVVWARAAAAMLTAATFMNARARELKHTMDDNRRDRNEALGQDRERKREERARRLMEEISTYSEKRGGKKNKPAADPQRSGVDEDLVPENNIPVQHEFIFNENDEIVREMIEDAFDSTGFFQDEEIEEVEAVEKPRRKKVVAEKPALPEMADGPANPLVNITGEAPSAVNVDDEEVRATTGEPDMKIQWHLPDPDDWLDPKEEMGVSRADMTLRDKLDATLKSFAVPASISNVVQGASFTRFEVTLEPGVKVARIVSLESDIALSLAADSKTIRIEAPIPGKSAIGIEVPNRQRAVVPMRKIFLSQEFQRNARGVLTFVLGEDISGMPIWANLVKMPHLLVAGSTNSGKSVCLNCIITSILARAYPDDVRFIMVDMKRVELTPYEGIPHLLTPVVTEPEVAASALKWVCEEMDRRYKMFAEKGVRNIDGYNKLQEEGEEKLHRIVVVIDELADLMMVSSANLNVEHYICRIAQLARATGIHIILATQRPDTKVITGTIKNNIPSRMAFAVPTQIDSRTILDQKGAESLLGRGDMIYMSVDSNRLIRLQGTFVSDKEVNELVDFWKDQGVVEYPLKFVVSDSTGMPMESEFMSEDEELYSKAVEIVVTTGMASISSIQRKLRIGYNRAARLVELMEDRGVVGPYDGSKPREVLLTRTGFEAREY